MWSIRGSYFITATFLLLDFVASLQVTEKNLRYLLNDKEWQSIVGTGDAVTDSHYTLTHPVYDQFHISPKTNGSASRRLEIPAPQMGRTFKLQIFPSQNLLSDDFKYLQTANNGTQEITHTLKDNCYYRSDTTALDLCEGVRGIVYQDDKHYFVINPLPKRFHNDTFKPHLLVRKKNKKTKEQHKCSHDVLRNSNSSEHRLLKRSLESEFSAVTYIRDNMQFANEYKRVKRNSKIEHPVFIETAVFVDRGLFDHMKSNFPADTERELIRFVLAMINAVQMLYHDPSLGRSVNFVLKRLEILKEEVADLTRSADIDKYLSSFCSWQKTKNPGGDRERQHWDHALMLTGLDLYVRGKHGKISSQVVGLAPVAGMCTATSSCTVNEGRHFESVYVVAHEIGHNLGMRHDGPLAENDCDPSGYLMSPTLGSGKITWSPCSRRYLQKFLESSQAHCLLDHGSSAGQLDHSAEGTLPGERFGANQQCMLKYGRGSQRSSKQPLDDICRDLHCEKERYTWTSHPALEGTKCGHNMWCRGGRCISKTISIDLTYNNSKSPLGKIEKIDGGWTEWKYSKDCASACLSGDEGRLRSGSTGIMIGTRICNNPRPQAGGAKCKGYDRKYQACAAHHCANVPRITVREFAEQYCSRAKDADSDLIGSGLQKISSDPVEACTVWCQTKNGSPKSRGWTFPDGTVCQMHTSRYRKAAYCINGRCEEFICDNKYNETQFAQLSGLCPDDKEDNEITLKVGVRRRDTKTGSDVSKCHFNCILPGMGIRLIVNKPKQRRPSIQLCQPNRSECGRVQSPFQYATTVCSKYRQRVRRLSGLGMQISSSTEDPDRSCKVACQDEQISHRFYLVNGEGGWFPFGTDCSRDTSDKKSYCISGKCLDFGQENTPIFENDVTLKLLPRRRRSLDTNSTKLLLQEGLDVIIDRLKATILGETQYLQPTEINIDLHNPIHIHLNEKTSDNLTHNKVNKFSF